MIPNVSIILFNLLQWTSDLHRCFKKTFFLFQFFELGSPEQRKELANQLSGQMLPLCLQMYGCRVIQKVF